MRSPSRLVPLAVLVMLACVHAPGPARAEEPPLVDGPGFYAGRDAAWWVEELRGAGTSRVAIEALKIIGAPALPALAAVLDHHDPTLRDVALALLREIPGDLRPVAPQLGLALENAANEATAQRLLELVSRLGPDGSSMAPRVVPFVASENANLRAQALSTLERTGGDAAVLVPALRPLLAAPDAGVHVLALKVLAKLGRGGAPALPEVLALLRSTGDEPSPNRPRGVSRDREIQAIAVLQGIGPIGPEGMSVLAALVKRSDIGLAPSAAAALARLGATEPEAAEALVGCLTSGDEGARSAALQALTALASVQPLPQAAVDVLLAMLSGEDPLAANQALAVLDRIDLPVAPLTVALVRAAAHPGRPAGMQRAWARLFAESANAAILALPAEPVPLPEPVLLGLLEQVRFVGAPEARVKALAHLAAWARTFARHEEAPPGLENAMVSLVGSSSQSWTTLEPLVLAESAVTAHLAAGVVARAESLRPMVLALLASPEPARRRAALGVLARQTGPFAHEQDAALVRALEDPVVELRELAAQNLLSGRGTRDPAQRPAEVQARLHAVILAALRAPEPERRFWGVGVVHGFLPPSQEAIDALLPLLADEALGIAFQGAAQGLARVASGREEATCTRLLAELEGRDALRGAGAALGLATLGCHKERVLAALPALLRAESVGARARALRTARVLGAAAVGGEIESGVRALVRSPEVLIGVEALTLLPVVAKDLPAARAALLEVARTPRCAWNLDAITALGQLGALAAEDLVDLMAEPALRARATYTLGTLGSAAHDVLPRLQAELARAPGDRALKALVDSLTRAPGFQGR